MCRTTTTDYHHLQRRHRLKITGFYLRLSLSSSSTTDLLPDSLTLVLLPRTGNAAIHVNGSKVPSDSPAFVSLHRILSPDDPNAAVFAARERLRSSDAFSFEIHAAQHRLLSGLFRRHDDDSMFSGGSWRMECKCASVDGINFVREAEVSVALEDGGVMREKMTMRPRRCRRRGFRVGLEDIPEERDEEYAESDGACCCCGDATTSESDGEDEFDYYYDGDHHQKDAEMEMEVTEGVGWAVDVGIWVVCLGVGLLVSTASARRLRRRRLLR